MPVVVWFSLDIVDMANHPSSVDQIEEVIYISDSEDDQIEVIEIDEEDEEQIEAIEVNGDDGGSEIGAGALQDDEHRGQHENCRKSVCIGETRDEHLGLHSFCKKCDEIR